MSASSSFLRVILRLSPMSLNKAAYRPKSCTFFMINNYKNSLNYSAIRTFQSSTILRNSSINQNRPKTKEEFELFLKELSEEERGILVNLLNIDEMRHSKYYLEFCPESPHHILSKFGRPSTFSGEVEDSVHTDFSHHKHHDHIESLEKDSSTHFFLPKTEILQSNNESHPNTPASRKDIWAVGLKNALPFVGFGFLDNLIMILAGDYIDVTIGTALGISTMAAAALGNTISDVAGIASAWYVELFAEKFGIYTPNLTPYQFSTWQVRWSINFGRALGVTIGCLLGMLPLLFLPFSSKEKGEKERSKTSKE